MTKSSRILLAGSRGNLGTAFATYMKREHPEVGIVPLLPFPFSFQAIAGHLQSGTFTHFVNLVGKGDNGESQNDPYSYFDVNSIGVLKHLEMIRQHSPSTRYLNVGTIYELDPTFSSPYVSSKRIARQLVECYRKTHGLYVVTATLGFTEYYNRAETYLARKITKGAARIAAAIKKGEAFEPLVLRDIDQKFTWTWAEDVSDGMWRMMNQELRKDGNFQDQRLGPIDSDSFSWPHDYILANGETHTVREFVEKAFAATTLDNGRWYNPTGNPQDEVFELGYLGHELKKNEDGTFTLGPVDEVPGKIRRDLTHVSGLGWNLTVVRVDSKSVSTNEINPSLLDSSRARTELGWSPRYSFQDLVKEMVEHDLKEVGL